MGVLLQIPVVNVKEYWLPGLEGLKEKRRGFRGSFGDYKSRTTSKLITKLRK
jgi:hypothetical protein